MDTVSHCASLFYLNGRSESSSFRADSFTADRKHKFNPQNKVIEPVEVTGNAFCATNSFPTLKKYKFSEQENISRKFWCKPTACVQNSVSNPKGLRSKQGFALRHKMLSDAFTATDRMQSEASDAFTAFDKALSEVSDSLTATDKLLSEVSDGFTATDKLLSKASDGLPATDKVLSKASDGLPATDKVLSKASDGLPATDKVLSEASDGFTATDRMPSEVSDTFTATDKVQSEVSDGFTANNKALSEVSDAFTAINSRMFGAQNKLANNCRIGRREEI